MRNIIILLTICVLTIAFWFRQGYLIVGGEEGIAFYNPSRVLQLSQSIWIDSGTGFAALDFLPKLPQYYFSLIVHQIFHEPFITQLVLLFTLMATAGVSMNLLTKFLFSKIRSVNNLALFASIFYLFNPYTMTQVWGRGIYAQLFMFAGLPLLLLIFAKGLQKKEIQYLFLFGLVSICFAPSFGVITNLIVLWSVLLVYLICYVFQNFSLKKNIMQVSYFLGMFVCWSIVNAWWFFPLVGVSNLVFFGRTINPNENIGTLLGVSIYFPFTSLIRLLQNYYFFNKMPGYLNYSEPFLQMISWIPVVLLVVGLTQIKKSKSLLFFFLITIIGLLVSLGSNPPLGKLFVWVFNNVAILQSFRNPYEKFGLVFMFGYSVFVGFGLAYITEIIKALYKPFRHIPSAYLAIPVFILISGVYLSPFWSGRFFINTSGTFGVNVPTDYHSLNELLDTEEDSYRVVMTPLVAEGIVQKWNGRLYNGVDTSLFLVNQPVISSTPQIPYYQELVLAIRKYHSRTNIVPMLSALRAKYVVGRGDVVGIQSQIASVTDHIYIPQETQGNLCTDLLSTGKLPAVGCFIEPENQNASKMRYLHVSLIASQNAAIEIALKDAQEIRPRWDGVSDLDYRVKANTPTNLILPLDIATEQKDNFDWSSLRHIEIIAHPLDSENVKLQVSGIGFDPGKKQNVSEFTQTKEIGKLKVYSPTNFHPVKKIGTLKKVSRVDSFPQLFTQVEKKRTRLNTEGFLVNSQNKHISFDTTAFNNNNQMTSVKSTSLNKYLVTVKSKEPAYLVLNSTFHPGWKVISNAESTSQNSFFENLRILKADSVSEKKHGILNGYANIWQVSGANSYTVVFLPDVYSSLGKFISWVGIFVSVLWIAVSRLRGMKSR